MEPCVYTRLAICLCDFSMPLNLDFLFQLSLHNNISKVVSRFRQVGSALRGVVDAG
jgi:hypothetical protein